MTPALIPILSLPLADYRPVAVDLSGHVGDGFATATLRAADTNLDALLHEVEFVADLLLLQPAPADLAPTLARALAFCSPQGDVLLVADEAALQATLFAANASQPTWANHVWAHLVIPGNQPDTLGIVWFARCHTHGCSAHVTLPGGQLDLIRTACENLKRERYTLRDGPEAARYLRSDHCVELWRAVQAEYEQRTSLLPPPWHLHLQHGRLKCELTPFDCFRLPPGEAADGYTLNGKTLREIVVRRPQRQLLASLLASNRWRIQPAVLTALQTARREAIAKLQALRAGIPATVLPTGLNATLRPYQKDGFDFLAHLAQIGRGGILADDMGLGKTLQTLTWLLWLKQQRAAGVSPAVPSLVVCPASVMNNWRREAEKFTPCAKAGEGLKVLVLSSGPKRQAALANLNQFDLVITNYALLRRDLTALAKHSFAALILDEAQFIKNPGAQITQDVKTLGQRAQHRLALTGTPLENRLLDLWSIVDFAAPGYLGTQAEFKATYHSDDGASRRALARQLRPLMLRRLKSHVAKDLPARIELRRDCELGNAQMAFYREELRRTRDEVFQVVNAKGIQKSKLHVLAALTRLRQICCHPKLVGHSANSGKLKAFFELLATLAGQKVLVFSQFTRMLELLQTECRQRGIKTWLLTGETQDRQSVVDAFNAGPENGVFLLSLRAAGTGLNLTTASEVILYDPWWNPAVEAQAIDRSHRIGQTRTVNAHRLIMRDTIEERIWNIQQDKAATISSVLGEGGFTRSLTKTDLEYLFAGVDGEPSTINSQPSTQPSEFMLPRHPSNHSVQRNTRAPHPAEAPPSSNPTTPSSTNPPPKDTSDLPLWRQRFLRGGRK